MYIYNKTTIMIQLCSDLTSKPKRLIMKKYILDNLDNDKRTLSKFVIFCHNTLNLDWILKLNTDNMYDTP